MHVDREPITRVMVPFIKTWKRQGPEVLDLVRTKCIIRDVVDLEAKALIYTCLDAVSFFMILKARSNYRI